MNEQLTAVLFMHAATGNRTNTSQYVPPQTSGISTKDGTSILRVDVGPSDVYPEMNHVLHLMREADHDERMWGRDLTKIDLYRF